MSKRDTMQPIENLDPDDFIDALFDPNDPAVSNDPLLQIIKHLYDTINTLITHINTNNATVDKVKDNLSSDIDLDTLASNVSTNNAKTGITTSQANAITANTAKTGITTSQANAIVANTAKTGITTSQANSITTNNAICEASNLGRFRGVASEDGKVKFDVAMSVGVNAKTGAPAALNIQVTTEKGQRFRTVLALQAVK